MDLEQILRFAVKHGISDIHVKVGREPLFRHLGLLVTQKGSPKVTRELVGKWLRGMTTQAQQDELTKKFELDFGYAMKELGRFRVNVFNQRGEPGFVMRHIPAAVRTIEELELPGVLQAIAENQRGLVLVTGATGSGKSTTLAAMLEHVNRTQQKHIVTIEDPIEFMFTDRKSLINQRQVGDDTKSFPAALRAALRQDPDVILIGELRDLETVETALHAAETGHLVMSTLHTVDARETVNRFIGLFPPHQQEQVRLQLASIIRGVISQRLIRTVDGRRVAACEVLVGTELVGELIADKNRTFEIPMAIAQGAATYGMQTFDQALLDLWKAKRISAEEAQLNATNPAQVKMQIEGID
jgi:twitching motility protein PilT